MSELLRKELYVPHAPALHGELYAAGTLFVDIFLVLNRAPFVGEITSNPK